jgi:hypothetical protein
LDVIHKNYKCESPNYPPIPAFIRPKVVVACFDVWEKVNMKKKNIYLNMFGDGRGPTHFHAHIVENK